MHYSENVENELKLLFKVSAKVLVVYGECSGTITQWVKGLKCTF
jgi:hypothetical protein